MRTIRPYVKPILAHILEGIGSVGTPYGVILPRDQVEDMAVRPFTYVCIINISIG